MQHLHGHSHMDAPETRGSTIRWAKYYDHLVGLLAFGRENALRAETIRIAAIQPGATVLDVGCGTGTLTFRAKTAAGLQGKVYGIDPAPEMIEVARQKAARQKLDVQYQVGVIEALKFPDASVDVVLSSMMMHHLPDDLKRAGLAEIYRVLKPGGRLVIVDIQETTNAVQHFSLTAMIHARAKTGIQSISALLSSRGFTGIETGNMPMRLGYIRAQRGS
ncbi:MAG: methyltransferase domain-containing protein [Chloroflexi bacterium]|nr:methyltransferase domain-containing protein [Chloroflexota bacterium]